MHRFSDSNSVHVCCQCEGRSENFPAFLYCNHLSTFSNGISSEGIAKLEMGDGRQLGRLVRVYLPTLTHYA